MVQVVPHEGMGLGLGVGVKVWVWEKMPEK
jgi:hypothetical protein